MYSSLEFQSYPQSWLMENLLRCDYLGVIEKTRDFGLFFTTIFKRRFIVTVKIPSTM